MSIKEETDITDDLLHSYEEQCFIQINSLREKLLVEEANNKEKSRKLRKHRLYRYNIFETIESAQKQYLDRLLCHTLRLLGQQINKNLVEIARENAASTLRTPTPVRDLSLTCPTSSRPGSVARASPVPHLQAISSAPANFNPAYQCYTLSSDEDADIEDENIRIKIEPVEPIDDLSQDVSLGDIDAAKDYMARYHPEHCIPGAREEEILNISNNSLLIVNRKIISNYIYDHNGVIHLKPKKCIKFSSLTPPRQALFLHIVSKVLKLIQTDNYMTKRELYYKSLDFCKVRKIRSNSQAITTSGTQAGQTQVLTQTQTQASTQSTANIPKSSQAGSSQRNSQVQPPNTTKYSTSKLELALDDLCCLVGCSRVHLHLLTQAKGIVYGNLQFQLKSGEVFDCLARKDGVSLPPGNVPITNIESDAKFILVLEKDSVLQNMLKQEETYHFVKNYKVILFTARGYPDVTSKAFLNFLWIKLKIPIIALTDADPHGLEIVCSYKFGCYSTAYESVYLAVPQIKWLGLLPSDIKNLSLPKEKTMTLSSIDKRKLNSLLIRPYLMDRPDWMRQLELMRKTDRKAEIESLDATGEYLVQTFLPNKLRYASWL